MPKTFQNYSSNRDITVFNSSSSINKVEGKVGKKVLLMSDYNSTLKPMNFLSKVLSPSRNHLRYVNHKTKNSNYVSK